MFSGLPDEAKEEWTSISKNREKATEWLMKRMRKENGKWTFCLHGHANITKDTALDNLSKHDTKNKLVPRFRAVVKAGGEAAFSKALLDGEIFEQRSSSDPKKVLYGWKEEQIDKSTSLSKKTTIQQYEDVDQDEALELSELLDFRGEYLGSVAKQESLTTPTAAAFSTGTQLALTFFPQNNPAGGLPNFQQGAQQAVADETISDGLWQKLDEVRCCFNG